ALRAHHRLYRPTLLDGPPAYVWLCRPPPRLRRYSPSKLGEISRPADPLPGSAGTPPASRGRNPGLPTPSPAPPVLPSKPGEKSRQPGPRSGSAGTPQQAGGKVLATPARPNMPGENPLGDR